MTLFFTTEEFQDHVRVELIKYVRATVHSVHLAHPSRSRHIGFVRFEGVCAQLSLASLVIDGVTPADLYSPCKRQPELGVESNSILNSAFFASSFVQGREPYTARLNGRYGLLFNARRSSVCISVCIASSLATGIHGCRSVFIRRPRCPILCHQCRYSRTSSSERIRHHLQSDVFR